jgi:capping protein beta
MSTHNQKLEDCILLINRLPVSNFDKNMTALSNLIYEDDELLNEFLQKLDNRIEICKDDILGEFIKSEYNREGDSYRSPHSNKYFPEPEDDDIKYPSHELRELEIKLNKIFQIYTRNYYSPNAIISAYVWHLEKNNFAVSILIRNNIHVEKDIDSGVWDSINIINVSIDNTEIVYKLTTTVSLQMSFQGINLSGSITKQVNIYLC